MLRTLLSCFGFVAQVTWAAPPSDARPQDWAHAGHDLGDTRFSPLTEINDSTVGRLGLAWSYDLDTHRGQEATPVVIDGVMYTTSAWSKAQAFKADTGELLWQFDPKVPGQVAIHACCDVVNRGVAVAHGRVYLGSLDGRLIALDARTGKQIWSVLTVDRSRPYSITGAPLLVRDMVLIGNGGAEYGVRGYVTAYDAVSGKQRWRFYTVPGDPAKGFESEASAKAATTWKGSWWKDGGGGTVWNSFSYDPALDLVYFGTGNAAPWGRAGPPGDDLYTASIVALHASTGRYAWHYQTTPGDVWDYDSDQTLTLATLSLGGRPREVIMQAAKNGFFYVLDRRTGELLSAKNFVPVNWASAVDLKTGRPMIDPAALYAQTGKVWLSMPGAFGGHNWQPDSFSPATGLVYIPAQEIAVPYLKDPQFERSSFGMNVELDNSGGAWPLSKSARAAMLAGLKGYLSAWDPVAQREMWRADHPGPWNGGTLATAGNLVFQGTAAGQIIAYRATDGHSLWSTAAQTGVIAAPMTFAVGTRQYVSVLAGWGGVFPLAGGDLASKSGHQVNRSRILTFALDASQQLPTAAPDSPPVLSPPTAKVDSALAKQGAREYSRVCADCHGGAAISGGLVPDLRYSNALKDDGFWKAVVNDGALVNQGMVAFKAGLSPSQQTAVRAYLIQRAQDSYAAEDVRATPRP